MERAPSIVLHYETVAQLAGKMLEAAQEGQWDELAELEKQRAAVLSVLMADAEQGAIPAEVADQVARLIASIQQMDAECVALVQAWQVELKAMLGSMGIERKISKAYGP